MLNKDFYHKIDQELSKIIEVNQASSFFTHKNEKQNKPIALLMWFLDFYGKTQLFSRYITEGKGDSSCDIILDVEDVEDGRVFYVVQSKWNNLKNSAALLNATLFKSTLDDFRLVIQGEKGETINKNFNRKYEELLKHAEQNGKVKFVYLTLASYNPEIEDNIKAFEKDFGTSIEILDLNRIKRDYIDFNYKKIIPTNPLENERFPTEEIELKIEQLNISQNYLKIDKPFGAYIFLLRPKTIFELFEKYKFKLFFKNVRNPLISSKVNENIEATLKDEIPYFWYFNNGITALTNYVDDYINPTAKSIKIIGLHVINGAQTVYSIYKSYKEASAINRKIMNRDALLTMRLLIVNSESLSLKITRYTNSQNPMEERDFRANDDIQVRLQQESFQTKYWYEKRRGEFRDVPEGVEVITNKDFAIYHLAFNLEKPNETGKSLLSNKDLFFISRQDNKDGLYEDIFLENPISFKMLLAAYLFAKSMVQFFENDNSDFEPPILQIITLSKILLKKYLSYKFSDKLDIIKFILDKYEKEQSLFIKIIKYTTIVTYNYLGEDEDKLYDFILKPIKFELVKDHFEQLEMTSEIAKAIENQTIEDEEI